MYKPVNIDAAVKHIKNIVDNSCCTVCDKTGGRRLRYVCGHTSCDDCVALAVGCSVCLTPQSSSLEPVIDETLTQRAANAVNLLNVFQNAFHIDVYKRQRISEQLRLEKEIFPECIQAPMKYSNKNKSLNNTKVNKENRLSQLPGEEILLIANNKMEDNSENVELWLNKYVRKPFADLNSNDKRITMNTKTIKGKQKLERENTPIKRATRKRPIKTASSTVKNQSLIVEHLIPTKIGASPLKKRRIEAKPIKLSQNVMGPNISSTDNNESGIAMDEDSVVVIDNSQSIQVDKDMNAWLAVQEAERNKPYTSTETTIRSIEITPVNDKEIETKIELKRKVPFYLKSHLAKDCNECEHDKSESDFIKSNTDSGVNDMESPSNVLITVENSSFVAVITIKQVDETTNKTNSMQSVEVQTDETENKCNIEENVVKKSSHEPQSQDIFQDDKKPIYGCDIGLKPLERTENVIIQESDSDGEVEEASVSMEVTAEVHRSCEETDYGILADINDVEEHSKRPRRAPRGITPTSTDSSEKENYNPNRMKNKTSSKKKPMKK